MVMSEVIKLSWGQGGIFHISAPVGGPEQLVLEHIADGGDLGNKEVFWKKSCFWNSHTVVHVCRKTDGVEVAILRLKIGFPWWEDAKQYSGETLHLQSGYERESTFRGRLLRAPNGEGRILSLGRKVLEASPHNAWRLSCLLMDIVFNGRQYWDNCLPAGSVEPQYKWPSAKLHPRRRSDHSFGGCRL